MCGIAGLWWDKSPRTDAARMAVIAMAEAIRHRGPDAGDAWIDAEAGVALGHRRLAILDLSPAGAQPMHSASGRHVIVFNGEIYNFRDLARTLEVEGRAPAWRGHSDTEVLLAAIEAWGVEAALARAFGMFAFALWDRAARQLVLARDRIGEKPLHYGRIGGAFAFASELKAFEALEGFDAEPDRAAIAAYLRFGYLPAPHTIWQGIAKLPPGCLLRLAAPDATPAPAPYWSLKAVAEAGAAAPEPADFASASRDLEALLGDVTASQMVSDVPLGAFLSGGIDSSLVTALMQARSSRPVRSFSIGFGEARFDEASHARAVAAHLGTEHTEFTVTEAEALALVPDLPHLYDEPFADSSQLPTLLLARLTRAQVTVALSGDGGDEMFAGYNRHRFAPGLWARAARLPAAGRRGIGRAAGLAQRLVSGPGGGGLSRLASAAGLPVTTLDRLSKFGSAIGRAADFSGFYREIVATFPDPTAIADLPPAPEGLLDRPQDQPRLADPLDWMMALDALTYLPDDIMVKVDRAAMAASLETRAPFLDARVVGAAWRLPRTHKLRDGRAKAILRDILFRHVPQALVERPKQGFAVPLDAWLRGRLRDWAADLLAPTELARHGIFRPEAVAALWSAHLAGRDNAGARLWTVLQLQAWLRART